MHPEESQGYDISFTIVGVGEERKIYFAPTSNDSALFTLGSRGNLKLIENVTLVGYPNDIGIGGGPFKGFVIGTDEFYSSEITMEAGSKITGHRSSEGVIQLRGQARLVMRGNAEISGNTYIPPVTVDPAQDPNPPSIIFSRYIVL